ncbi:MAG: hypothetical protein HY784_13585, partial [Chloroflexi bacterium]|nr:hypothetical protein [Chloroflexota bacterium]
EFAALLHLPQGTEVLVLGVNGPGNWYAVDYQGQALWLSASRVDAVAQGQPAAPADPNRNLRGVHWAPAVNNPPGDRNDWNYWLGELRALKIGWIKLLDTDNPSDGAMLDFARFWKSNGIEPIMRIFIPRLYPDRLPPGAFIKMQNYAAAGVRYVEIGNEPNLSVEWQDRALNTFPKAGDAPIISSNDAAIVQFSDGWLADAEETLARGCWPAYPAMSPTDWYGGVNTAFSSVEFYRRSFRYYAADAKRTARFRRLLQQGAWLAVHTSWRQPGSLPIDLDPFRDTPNPNAPWDICLRGYEVPLHFLRDMFGLTDVRVLSTEGGAFSPEHLRDHIGDPPYSEGEWFNALVKVYDWLAKNSSMVAMCPWVLTDGYGASGSWPHNGWYRDKTPRSIVPRLKQAWAHL